MGNFDLSDLTAFRRAVEILHPGATGSDLVELLDGRAKRTTALQWQAGRCHAPRWAIETLVQKIRAQAESRAAIAQELESLPDRPGRKAGSRNLAV